MLKGNASSNNSNNKGKGLGLWSSWVFPRGGGVKHKMRYFNSPFHMSDDLDGPVKLGQGNQLLH